MNPRDKLIILVATVCMVVSYTGAGMLIPSIKSESHELQLTANDSTIENMPADIAILYTSLASFRGIFVDILWGRATQMKQEGKHYEAFKLAELITKLQPRFPKVWAFHAWNMAYNISVTTHTPEERWMWVQDGIKLLRDQGEEAYIHHGPVHSSVCIGAFPKAALRTFQQADAMTGRVQVVQRIVDPKMLAVQKRYPHNLHNGAKMYQVVRKAGGQKGRELHLSFAVEVPKPDPFQIK